MPRAKPALPVRKKEKCGHAKGGTRTPCPQKRKMRPCQGWNTYSLSAKAKNAAMPRAEPALPVRKKEKCGHVKGGPRVSCPQCRKARVSVFILCLLHNLPLLRIKQKYIFFCLVPVFCFLR